MTHPRMAGSLGTETSIEDEMEIDSLLGVLDDEDCRAIIEATSTQALSAGELSESCDLAQSTAYRKVDELTEAGLLEEQIRLSSSGQHKSEYTLRVDQITLALDSEGLSLDISTDEPAQAGHSAVAGAD